MEESFVSTGERGLLPRSRLHVKTKLEEDQGSVIVKVQWYDKTDNAMVREDVFVNLKSWHSIGIRTGL